MKKILVIEDERSIRRLLVKLLAAEGFQAIEAENGSIGVHLAKQHCPDLIFCDIMMPELDGYEVLALLQQDPATATIPFICLTARDDRADLRRGMEQGASDYLTKPFTKDELLGAITAQLAKQERVRQQQTTALQEAIAKLELQAHYDSLTNLPNRLLLRERFHQILATGEHPWQLIPVLVLSLDQFDRFHFSLGESHSTLLLKQVTERLLSCTGERGTVARLQPEQFALLLPPVPDSQVAATIAQTLLETLSQPFTLEEYQVLLTSSIGIALYPEDGSDLEALLKKANAAILAAQQLGGNRYQLYTPAIQQKSYERLMLEISLQQAVERGEFQLYYQPQVDLRTGQIVGAEALVRWQHPDRGLVSPAEFIPIAEETGLIVSIDDWVLQTACQQAKDWHTAGVSLSVAVNISGIQFNEYGLINRVFKILETTGFNPSSLELELTESAVVQNPQAARATLKELKALGIKLSLDDFGTGYSSLSYLQQFPFDTLKIDRSFVSDLTQNSKNAAIVLAIIQLAHSLNLKVIAEGVETAEEQDFLRQYQCDVIQGYWFSPPLTAAALEKMLKEQSRSQKSGLLLNPDAPVLQAGECAGSQ